MWNARFYSGAVPTQPGGHFVHTILQEWPGDYERLEADHHYVQWLFPTPEPSGVGQEALDLGVGERL